MSRAGVATSREEGSGWAGQTHFLRVNGNSLSVPCLPRTRCGAADCPVLRLQRAWGPHGHCPQVPFSHSASTQCLRGAPPCGHCCGRDSGPRGGLQLQAGGWRPEWHTEQRCHLMPGWGGSTRTCARDQDLLLHAAWAGESSTFLSPQKGQLARRHPRPPCPGAWASKRKPGVSR